MTDKDGQDVGRYGWRRVAWGADAPAQGCERGMSEAWKVLEKQQESLGQKIVAATDGVCGQQTKLRPWSRRVSQRAGIIQAP